MRGRRKRSDTICQPLLASLNELKIRTNICQGCYNVVYPASELECQCLDASVDTRLSRIDPRYNEQVYFHLSTWQKSKAMGEFASTLVASFHSKLGYDNFKQQQSGFNFDEANNPGLLS
jgi:hypothetical protein